MSSKMKSKNGNGRKPEAGRNNPVAKNMDKFNKAQTHRDRKNDYKRNDKHKGRRFDPYFLTSDKYFNDMQYFL